MLFFVAQIFCLDKPNLLKNNNGADEQENSKSKLKNDQTFSEKGIFCADNVDTFQSF